MKSILLATTGLTVLVSAVLGHELKASAVSITLYNGSGLPSSQTPRWLAPGALNSSGSLVPPSQTLVSGGVRVVTNAGGAEYSGYSNYAGSPLVPVNPAFPTLDRNAGYTISFNVSLDSSTTNSLNRSAFSIIAISSDLQGIELGFEPDLIFAQRSSPDPTLNFTRAETSSPITTSASTNYQLSIAGNNYNLTANGSNILSGALRTYIFDPATSSPPLPFNPYTTPNFLFFGDSTGQESGTFTFRSASVTTGTAIPYDFSPGLGLLIVGGAAAWYRFKVSR